MAYSLNKVLLIGNVGKDPELQYSTIGTAYCKFSLATTERVKDKSGEWENQTQWFNIVMFGKVAETYSKLIAKGSKIFVEGKFKSDEYEKDGVKRQSFSIIVSDFNNVVLLDKKDSRESTEQPEVIITEDDSKDPMDDLPF